ncbi:hypothetical protein IT571_05850 [Candidatus Sumerlaeota bacterium]|nr:hypothetical protein [Candidatus Sumerlaeota bacterium]
MQLPLGLRRVMYGMYGGLRAPFARRDVILWPPVGTQKRLDDFVARLKFHFPRDCEITIPHAPGLQPPVKTPWYLADYSARCSSEFRFVAAEGGNRSAVALALRHRGVVLTEAAEKIPGGGTARFLPNGAPLDPGDVEMETFWLAKFHDRGRATASKNSRRHFEEFRKSLPKKKKVYLLCTGPSLSRFAEFDFSDGYVIGCNTVVSNEALMKHAAPDFVVASDPIFHFGPGIYAEKFRVDLAAAAQRQRFLFMTLATYHHLVPHHVMMEPSRVALPQLRLDVRARSFDEAWSVPQTANIMTMFMLPLARTLAKEVHIIGADGREPGETYFWKHDPASQLTDKMQAIKAAHPAFFAKRNYVDYYDRHCAIVASQIAEIERDGGRVHTLTPSFIPALRDRLAT